MRPTAVAGAPCSNLVELYSAPPHRVDPTGENPNSGCQIDWQADAPELDDGAIIVIGVSIHDAMCRAPAGDLEAMDWTIDASVYADVVEHYQAFGEVAVVEAPPVDAEGNAGFAEVSNDRLVELNQHVAQTLGCDLIGYDVRLQSPLYDGLHYIPGEFTEPTVISLMSLSPERTCNAG